MNPSFEGLPKALGNMALWLVPIGVGFDWWCDETDVPKGYIVPYGQDIEQAKYPRLYAKWVKNGTHRYGAGSTATSTKAPDKRGRVSVVKDDMGGTAANRVTNGISGIPATTLGAAGGSESLHGHNHGQNSGGQFGSLDLWIVDGVGPQHNIDSGVTQTNCSVRLTTDNTGAGNSQNMPPAIVCNYIIRAG